MIKIIDELLSSEISEAKNSVGKTARFSLSGDQAIAVGDTIIVVQKQGTIEKYFPLLVSSSEYKSKEGITVIEGRDLISQVFDCIIPDMADQVGEASVILKAILTEANTEGYIDVYLNDDNISVTPTVYTKVNVSKRKLGELFQDICQDTGYIMWVGYDELNDKQNAFFLKPESDFVQLHTALKEGVNIVNEDLKMSSIDDIRNFIILYYYPTREPFDEAWTEWSATNGQNRKLWYAKNTEIAKPWFAQRETRIRQNGPFCYLTVDAEINDTSLTVNSTAGFDDSGTLYFLGGDMPYSSKDATHFYLYDGLLSGVKAANSFIYQKDLTNLHTEFASFCVPVWGAKPIKKVGIYVNSKVGTPGTLKLRVVGWDMEGYTKVLYSYDLPSVQGWNYIDTDIKISDAGLEENPEHWLFWEFFISFDTVKTDANYYTLSMGQCLSLTNYLNEAEFWYWRAIGMPSIWGDMDGQAASEPAKMLSVYMESSYRAITEVWTGSGVVVGDNVWYNPWSSMHGYIHYLQKEGEGCIRAVGVGTFYKLITIGLANFDRIHFWRRNDITKIKLYCGGGTYEKAFTSNADWIEESLKFTEMVKVGTPNSTLSKIEFTVAGDGLIDSVYFLYPDSGLTIYVKDDVSIGQYKQKPLVIYAKGVTESSYATSLAVKILNDKKDLKWSGRIRVSDRLFDYVPGKSIRVIIDSKDLDEVFAIYGLTHYIDGTVELEVGSFYFDYEKFLSEIQSHIENLQIAIGSAQGTSTGGGSSGVYSNHAIKHQVGGSDEVNITGLDGQAADNQKSEWSLITNKPASAVADIDSAVTLKHSHANKALLDTYAQSEANLADAVSKKHAVNKDQYLDQGGANEVSAANIKANLHAANQTRVNSGAYSSKQKQNFLPGAGIGLGIAETADEVQVTITNTGGGGVTDFTDLQNILAIQIFGR